MKSRLGLIFAGALFLVACASSDDQLPSSPNASSPVITAHTNNGAPVTLSGYADTSTTVSTR